LISNESLRWKSYAAVMDTLMTYKTKKYDKVVEEINQNEDALNINILSHLKTVF